jgi:hypothetical protein
MTNTDIFENFVYPSLDKICDDWTKNKLGNVDVKIYSDKYKSGMLGLSIKTDIPNISQNNNIHIFITSFLEDKDIKTHIEYKNLDTPKIIDEKDIYTPINNISELSLYNGLLLELNVFLLNHH